MNSDKSGASMNSLAQAAGAVRDLIATAKKGALASLMTNTGTPYASLVNVAHDEGEPVLLLSRLAWHTQNILADSRACLLIAAEDEGGDALTRPRVSLIGKLTITDKKSARTRYLEVHPSARSYSQFEDFRFFKLNVDTAHYVAGFGQIITLERTQLFELSR
jgi:putative heme iron utilization protein